MDISVKYVFGEMQQPEQDNELLYHYCSMDSFVHIIEEKKIRFGNLNSMNDPSEMYIKNINFPSALLYEYNKNPFTFTQKYNSMEDYLLPSQIEHSIMQGGKHTNSLFAFCLSEMCNDLSQWRLYADDAQGVCLGFRKSKIEEFMHNNKNFDIQNVEYVETLDKIATKVSETILKKIKSMYDSKEYQKLDSYRYKCLHDIVNEWSKYKIKDYSPEKETRIVYRKKTSVLSNIDAVKATEQDKEIEIRLKKNNLVSFITVDLLSLGLETITLGPTNYNNKENINLLLAKNNIDIKSKNIYKSTIPYTSK